MPLFTGRGCRSAGPLVLLASMLVAVMAGCTTTLPDPPDDPIDRLPFVRSLPLDGEQAPETEGGRVHAVRWTVLECPAHDGHDRHFVMGSRGSTQADGDALPPGTLAVLTVCDASSGSWAPHKVTVHHGAGVPRDHYEPMAQPSVLLQDNTLEILGFEPGRLVLQAQPEALDHTPVGAPHRFEVTVGDGTAWRDRVSATLARMRDKAQGSGNAPGNASPSLPAVAHGDY